MNTAAATEIINAVRSLGGDLIVDGDRIRLRAPVEVPASLKTAIREHKNELVQILCPHGQGCPHSDEHLLAEYRHNGMLRIEYKGQAVYLVATDERAREIKEGTVYTMNVWKKLVQLSSAEIRQIHALRTTAGSGGSVEIQR